SAYVLEAVGSAITAVSPVAAPAYSFRLRQNYPNPFNPSTTIQFTVPSDGRASLKVFDILGREVATLVDGEVKAGVLQQATFDASKMSSGIYFARLQFGGKQLMKKMLLLK
ncbi:MAG TPA: T9SS type A sorting domain-containing protein, partial [Bacteroidota bacterium]|nr:T9SS type A sorting domain-containing protein [Bacteroidota bacterium]